MFCFVLFCFLFVCLFVFSFLKLGSPERFVAKICVSEAKIKPKSAKNGIENAPFFQKIEVGSQELYRKGLEIVGLRN